MTKIDGPTFKAEIMHIDTEPKNRSLQNYQHDCCYAKVLDMPYQDILLQGWVIYCVVAGSLNKCVITSMSQNNISVELYNPYITYAPMQSEYTIQYSDIESILLSKEAFSFQIK
jgi:hypothetical protein